MKEILIDGETLTFEDVVKVAYADSSEVRVLLSNEAKNRVNASANAVQKLLDRGEIAYGITTGFGAFKDKIISREEVEELQRNIVISHAVGVGDPFDTPTVRAIMLIRANTLARGFSGIKLATLQLLLELLNRGISPIIPAKGSLGASGDLAPLAHMACALIGVGKVKYKDATVDADAALAAENLKAVTLAAKEGLALTNGTTVMTAVGVLETYRAKKLAEIADICGCLSLEALNGTPAAFDERIHALRPHPRQIECAANLREILSGSEFIRAHDPANIQDAYTLRCIPQVHGACRDAIAYAEWVLDLELNAVTDNPLIFVDGERIDVVSGGNFHGEPLAIAFDYLAIAMAEFGNISERRIMRLTDEASNSRTLPAFLTENGGLNSGFMIVQYTAAALCTENKILAHPASVDTIPTSANVEDHVSMGATSSLKLRQIISNVLTIIALEALSAAQGIDLRKRRSNARTLGKGTRDLYNALRAEIPFIESDVFMKPLIDSSEAIINARCT